MNTPQNPPNFVQYSDTHGKDIEGTNSDIALLGGDYGDIREAENIHDLAKTVDETLSQASENYEEVKAIPGNHEVERVPPLNQICDQVTDQEGNFEDDSESLYEYLTGKKGKDPENAENLFELIEPQYENIEDVSYSSFELEDYTVVAGGSHENPEIPNELYNPELEDLDYEDDDLEQIVDTVEEEHETDYGIWGEIPYLGKAIEYIGDLIDYGQPNIQPDELNPRKIEELEQEYDLDLMTDKHEKYLEIKDEAEKKKEKLQSLIDEAEKPVIAFDHGLPMTDEVDAKLDYVEKVEEHKGSQVWKEILQENEIDTFLGGHFHKQIDEETYDTRILNPGEGHNNMYLEDEDIKVENHKLKDNETEIPQEQKKSTHQEQLVQQIMKDQDFETPQEAKRFLSTMLQAQNSGNTPIAAK